MQTKPKANSIITHAIADQTIMFNVKGLGTIALDMTRLHPAIMQKAAIHGLIQRISDAAAMSRTDDEGRIIPEATLNEAKFEAMSALVNHYATGTSEWSRVSEAGPRGGILFKALCRMYPERKPDEIREWLDGQSKANQAALRASEKVRAAITAIEAEMVTASPKVDTDALLADLTK